MRIFSILTFYLMEVKYKNLIIFDNSSISRLKLVSVLWTLRYSYQPKSSI
jgi:hypothetical protein